MWIGADRTFLFVWCTSVVLLLMSSCYNVDGFDFLDNFTPRLRTRTKKYLVSRSERIPRRAPDDAIRLIKNFGYPAEEHEVETEDGYLLTVHRIPHGRNNSDPKQYRPAVVFHHGAIAASDIFLHRSPDLDLAYILADSGYDVWLMNVRGNCYSRKHVRLDPDTDAKFWAYSLHEIAIYDIPASVDYILHLTGQSGVYYVAHSMGGTALLVTCSVRPEYNAKIKMLFGLAVPAMTNHDPTPPIYMLSIMTNILGRIGQLRNSYELLPRRAFNAQLLSTLCGEDSPTLPICLGLVHVVIGNNSLLLNASELPKLVHYYPAGSNLQTFVHLRQIFTSKGNFGPIDLGYVENMRRYRSPLPPQYDLSKITAPVTLFYGDGDGLVFREDTILLASRLVSSRMLNVYRVPYPNFNHMDFVWGSKTKSLMYDHIVRMMDMLERRNYL